MSDLTKYVIDENKRLKAENDRLRKESDLRGDITNGLSDALADARDEIERLKLQLEAALRDVEWLRADSRSAGVGDASTEPPITMTGKIVSVEIGKPAPTRE